MRMNDKMFKFLLILCLFALPISIKTASEKNKFVIGCTGAGFFSIFWSALNHIAWCERNNKIPVVYWDKECTYYQYNGYNGSLNAWEYYFEPVSPLRYRAGDSFIRRYVAPDGTGIPLFSYDLALFNTWRNSIASVNNIIKKYIRIKSSIQSKISNFYNTHIAGKKTIGIHLRGTDKHLELQTIAPEILINEANKYQGYQYLVATDEQKLMDLAIKQLNGKVIYYPAFRSANGKPVHHNPGTTNALRGEEVLIETILLAQCDFLIHTCSNVSISCYYFNPNLKGILFAPAKNRIVIN